MISQNYINELLSRADIVDVVDSRVRLRKQGKNYSACCPFHDEKSPSFTVNHEKQFYYCFGCGAGGGAIRFVSEYERLSFPDAVKKLAMVYGMEAPDEQTEWEAAQMDARKTRAQLRDEELIIAIGNSMFANKEPFSEAEMNRYMEAKERVPQLRTKLKLTEAKS